MSVLLLHKPNDKMSLMDLARLVLKFIFNKERCSYQTQVIIETNILKWYDLVKTQKKIIADKFGLDSQDFTPIGKKGTYIDEVEFFLQIISSWLVKDEKGEFDYKKDLWKRHKIDYRKTAEFGWAHPEVYTKEGFAKAQAILKQHMKDNPQDYNLT